MQLSHDSFSGAYQIQSYAADHVVVNQQAINRPVVLMPDAMYPDLLPIDFESLTQRHCQQLLDLEPQVILMGVPQCDQRLAPALHRFFLLAGKSVEVMTTPAACRTFMLLAAEQRRVCAALFMVG
jgi:uncharacterized protein